MKWQRFQRGISAQGGIIDGQCTASFFKQLANGSVEWLFIRQNQTGKKRSFIGTGFTQ
jgi:hypothetical protein